MICIPVEPVPITPITLALQRDRVVPLGRVEHGAGEGLQPLQRRLLGVHEPAGGRDDEVVLLLAPVVGAQAPDAVDPLGLGHARAKRRALADPEAVGDLVQVRPDLAPRRVALTPVRVGRKGVLVVARRDIAVQPRVGVRVPGAAEVVPLLVEVERLDAGHRELGGHADPRHAGADDRHARRPQRTRSVDTVGLSGVVISMTSTVETGSPTRHRTRRPTGLVASTNDDVLPRARVPA